MSTLILLPPTGYWDADLLDLLSLFPDHENIYIVTPNREVAYGKLGGKVIPDYSIRDILELTARPFDRIIIIADEGWEVLYDDIDAKTLVAGFLSKEIIAISLAPLLLAKWGFLKGKIATGNYKIYPELSREFIRYGAKPVSLPTFRDGNIITCMGREAVKVLEKYIEKIDISF